MYYGYIYKTTNLTNGKIYIGQKKGPLKPNYYGSGLVIKQALAKEGLKNFTREVIAYGQTLEQLNNLECRAIAKYRELLGTKNLYNITDGGVGVKRPCPEEVKSKIRSKAHKSDCTCRKCVNIRGEAHPKDCNCVGCRSHRGEAYKHNTQCTCCVCKNRRGDSVGVRKGPRKPRAEVLWEVRICACGCKGTFSCKSTAKKQFLFQHHKRGKKFKRSPESVAKTLATKRQIANERGYWHSDATRTKMSKPFSEEHKQKLRGPRANRVPREIRVCSCGCSQTFECMSTSTQQYIYRHFNPNPKRN